jgi:hypothetical protein
MDLAKQVGVDLFLSKNIFWSLLSCGCMIFEVELGVRYKVDFL